MLLDAIHDHKKLTRAEIDKLLWDVLSDQLTDIQKKNKIGNILSKLKREEKILNKTNGPISEWYLSDIKE